MRLPERILIGLVTVVVGGIAVSALGVTSQPAWQEVIAPALDFVGALFIRLITMIVIPLVIASIMIGVTSLGDVTLIA
jgi:Na+/H+-dicarboxylate symporter